MSTLVGVCCADWEIRDVEVKIAIQAPSAILHLSGSELTILRPPKMSVQNHRGIVVHVRLGPDLKLRGLALQKASLES